MTILTTIMTVAIHKKGQDPYSGEGVNMLSLVDDGGGFFLSLSQPIPVGKLDGISIDPEELEAIAAAGRMLLDQEGVKEK